MRRDGRRSEDVTTAWARSTDDGGAHIAYKGPPRRGASLLRDMRQMLIELRGGRALTAEGSLEPASVLFDREAIRAVSPEQTGDADRVIDVRGALVLPGIVDLHGDAFERQIMPRPGVGFPIDVALVETDRQMVANGITTAFHGLTWSWEPGLRGRDAARTFADALDRLRGRLLCDTRLHLRHETFNLDDVPEVSAWIEAGRVDLLAFNDHVGDIGRIIDRPEKVAKYADRSGIAPEDFVALYRRVAARAEAVPASIEALAALARGRDVPIASHDDASPAMRSRFHALGCSICEFPMDRSTAETAREQGAAIVMGAPNILRGGSHAGRLSAAESISAGLCDALTSDYYYPSILHAVLRLAADGRMPLAAAWDMVARRPAAAVGLDDRGVLESGRRADIVVVAADDPALPQVRATFVAGRLAHAANMTL